MKKNLVQDLIDIIRAEFEYHSKVPYKLHYIGKKKYNNAGDVFNVTVMNYFRIPFIKARISASNIFNIGSLLNHIVADRRKLPKYKSKKCMVIGSGFMYEPKPNEILTKELEIYALRGEITKSIIEKLLKKNIDCLLADAGILASYIFPKRNITKKYKLGIIPHCYDKNDKILSNINLQDYNYTIIDIETPVEELFEQINECECILSSSLHGLIFADSYGIPNRQLLISDRVTGGLFKFRDYYSAYKMELPEPVDLRKTTITKTLVNDIIKKYINLDKQIALKQTELVKIYNKLSINGNGSF